MILGFSTKFPWGSPTLFPEKILSGIKTTTIRKGNRWKAGTRIHYATGVRTQDYNQFDEGVAANVWPIRIFPEKKVVKLLVEVLATECEFKGEGFKDSWVKMWVGLEPIQIERLARTEGFDSVEDFWRRFNEPVRGQLIRWNDWEVKPFEKKV